ncbi:MAG TPA: DUF421 domain-containing protein [Ignavibacteria bacterium]|nr:DUF421 domain-containing protein [Ignavibacteria bacterium]
MNYPATSLMSYLITFASSIAIYLLIIVSFRLIGKKGLTDLTIPDLVLVIIIGESIGSIIPNENEFLHAVTCIISLVFANFVIDRLTYKFKWFKEFVEGVPVILIHNSKLINKNLKREKISVDDLKESMRINGIDNLNDVNYAVLETDGKISMIPKKE